MLKRGRPYSLMELILWAYSRTPSSFKGFTFPKYVISDSEAYQTASWQHTLGSLVPNFIESVGEAFFVLSLFHVVTGVHHGVGNDIRRHAVMDASESLCMELQRRCKRYWYKFQWNNLHAPARGFCGQFLDFVCLLAFINDGLLVLFGSKRFVVLFLLGKMASFTIFVEVDDVFSFSTSNVENDHYRIKTQLQI